MQAEDAMEWLLLFGRDWITWKEFRDWDIGVKQDRIPIYIWVSDGYVKSDNTKSGTTVALRISEKGLDLIKQKGNQYGIS